LEERTLNFLMRYSFFFIFCDRMLFPRANFFGKLPLRLAEIAKCLCLLSSLASGIRYFPSSCTIPPLSISTPDRTVHFLVMYWPKR
jgi:hypothetical protein